MQNYVHDRLDKCNKKTEMTHINQIGYTYITAQMFRGSAVNMKRNKKGYRLTKCVRLVGAHTTLVRLISRDLTLYNQY